MLGSPPEPEAQQGEVGMEACHELAGKLCKSGLVDMMRDILIDVETTALLVTCTVSGLMSKAGQDDSGYPSEFLSFSLSYSLACLLMGGEDRLSEGVHAPPGYYLTILRLSE